MSAKKKSRVTRSRQEQLKHDILDEFTLLELREYDREELFLLFHWAILDWATKGFISATEYKFLVRNINAMLDELIHN